MKGRDLDRERSEERRTLNDFLKVYNAGLPDGFPKATASLLEEYRKTHSGQFKERGSWSLNAHRKGFMDWLPAHLRAVEAEVAKV